MSNPFLLKGNPPMTDESARIKIYVACLASYNNGILHGRWIDTTLGEDHIRKQIEAILSRSGFFWLLQASAREDSRGWCNAHRHPTASASCVRPPLGVLTHEAA